MDETQRGESLTVLLDKAAECCSGVCRDVIAYNRYQSGGDRGGSLGKQTKMAIS